jgi:hypothetical protein
MIYPTEVPELEPIKKRNGDLFTIKEWKDAVRSGSFIDYDGFGDLATKTGVSNCRIRPSQSYVVLPKWATHILWYNR